MIADPPAQAGGQDIPGLLAAAAAKLDSIDGKLKRIEEEEIPAVNQRAAGVRRAAAAALAVAVAVALAMGALAWNKARQDAAEARSGCLAGNRARAQDLAAEERLVPAALGGTAAGRAEAARILALFQAKDRQRPCPG